MKKLVLLVVFAASCAADPPTASREAREAFEEWIRAGIDGNADKSFAMMSSAMKAEWLYARLEEGDPLARRWRGEMKGGARTDLDLWWGLTHKTQNGRSEPLSASVLSHPSTVKLFKEYFAQTAGAIRNQFSRLQIANIYSDDTGVTISVNFGQGSMTQLYGLVVEGDGWKIDSYAQPRGGR